MKSLSFRKDLIGVQEELLRFAYKLTMGHRTKRFFQWSGKMGERL